MSVDRIIYHSLDEYLDQPRLRKSLRDGLIHIDINRRTLIAIIASLMIHGLILFFAFPNMQMNTASSPPSRAIEVSLAPPTPQKVEQPPAPPPAALVKPQKAQPRVMTRQAHPHEKPAFSLPEKVAEVTPKVNQPIDMMSYGKSKQAQRQATEIDAAKQNAEAVAREVGPSEEMARDEVIKRNLQNGTNGIFDITSLSSRHATFAFRGWTNDYSSSRLEFFEVEAATGQDVRLVMIKRMIKLIREHYPGDFNWESHRLNRVIVLSARPQDNEGLEEFMMTEFFGKNYKNSQ